MLTEKRHSQILSILEVKESVTVSELVEELRTSESTIRRDLAFLDRNKWLKKVRGGAVKSESGIILTEPNVPDKKKIFASEKEMIAKYAASAINKSDFIFIDAGTTTEKMIGYINEKKATYVTNGFNHARLLAKRGLKVHLTGGELKESTEAIVGVSCLEMLRKFNFTKCFLGTNGISSESGFTTHDIEEASVKRLAAERSYVTYILADHSKFDKTAAVGFSGGGGVADRMGDAGIRNPADGIDFRKHIGIVRGHRLPVAVTGRLGVDALVAAGGIAVVNPEKAADLHRGTGSLFLDDTVHRQFDDFAGPELMSDLIVEIRERGALHGNRVSSLFLAENHRGPPVAIAGGVDPVVDQNQQ